MNKIEFENASVVTPAKVTINGIDYEVTPAQLSEVEEYLSAENLNLMQDNIEDAIDGIIESGTWTPTMLNCTSTLTTQGGTYKKIGNIVFYKCQLRGKITAVSSSGYSAIGGLPYSNQYPQTPGSVGEYKDCLTVDSSIPPIYVEGTNINIQRSDVMGVSMNSWKVTEGSSFYILLSGFYFTT